MSAPGSLGFNPLAKCLWSLEILLPNLKPNGGMGSVCAQTQGMRLERGPVKGETGKQILLPGKIAPKGGILHSNPVRKHNSWKEL